MKYLWITLLAACGGPSANMKQCDTLMAMRVHGDFDNATETPKALDHHGKVCEAACHEGNDYSRCKEWWMVRIELGDPDSPMSANALRLECDDEHNQVVCNWISHHKALYDQKIAEYDSNKKKADDEEEVARARRRKEAEDDWDKKHAGGGGTGDPIDQVLAKSDRELKAQGYEIVETNDRAVTGEGLTFKFSAHITDRMLQIVCAAHEGFHGTATSGSSRAEFSHVDPGISGAYVEHFAFPIDLDHAEQRFTVLPNWGNPARLACRVYKK